MPHNTQLPCDGDGICMICKSKPSDEDTLTCKTCVTPWHATCLSSPPETLASTLQWECPDCSPPSVIDTKSVPAAAVSTTSGDLIASIRAIEADESLTEQEKAKKRQELLSGSVGSPEIDESKEKRKENKGGNNDVLDLFDGTLNCSFCMQLPERPVTTPCGHNFCLKCFQKWTGQGKRTCAKCRNTIPPKMASQPRINSALVVAIRMARMSKSTSAEVNTKVYHFVHNQNRPDKAFTTERAKKPGKANACSGKIFVTVPPDHFGPILAENDPERKQGVLVGERWEDRMECRQWGAHLPHVAGIAGQSDYGAQSVALSGGYEDDEDHGEWFLYTGSGGRDLSGNKRTNKDQSFDQKFDKSNEALRVSCMKGYPVRVVRSHKEKRSSYAPETGVRYDGIYRIEKCWRKIGIQGFKVCRYLFVRCDNEPAPWTSDERGDHPRPLPAIKELKQATDITERKENPSWDYDEHDSCWKWKRSPPMSRKPTDNGDPEERKRARRAARQEKNLSVREKLLKEFSCLICRKVMSLPLTTPCAHNFCKPCLEGSFEGKTFVREITCESRTLRIRKNIMKCPSCATDISDFLQNPQVNRELMDVIESLQRKTEENIDDTEAVVDMSEHVEETSEESNVTVKSENLIGEIGVGSENFEIAAAPIDSESKGKKKAQKQKKIDGEENIKTPVKKVDAKKEEAESDALDSEMPKNKKENLQNPETEITPKRTSKRKKASGDGECDELVSGTPKKDMPDIPATETTPKRKKTEDGDCGSMVGGVKTRSMKGKELDGARNNSPASPFSGRVEEGQEKHKYKRKKANDEACLSELGGVKTRNRTKEAK